jgi:hypothetical protein
MVFFDLVPCNTKFKKLKPITGYSKVRLACILPVRWRTGNMQYLHVIVAAVPFTFNGRSTEYF